MKTINEESIDYKAGQDSGVRIGIFLTFLCLLFCCIGIMFADFFMELLIVLKTK